MLSLEQLVHAGLGRQRVRIWNTHGSRTTHRVACKELGAGQKRQRLLYSARRGERSHIGRGFRLSRPALAAASGWCLYNNSQGYSSGHVRCTWHMQFSTVVTVEKPIRDQNYNTPTTSRNLLWFSTIDE